jgi:hypothetical protein
VAEIAALLKLYVESVPHSTLKVPNRYQNLVLLVPKPGTPCTKAWYYWYHHMVSTIPQFGRLQIKQIHLNGYKRKTAGLLESSGISLFSVRA